MHMVKDKNETDVIFLTQVSALALGKKSKNDQNFSKKSITKKTKKSCSKYQKLSHFYFKSVLPFHQIPLKYAKCVLSVSQTNKPKKRAEIVSTLAEVKHLSPGFK